MIHNALISGGTFTQINHRQDNAFNELSRRAVLSATHDSGESFDRPGCHENTRVTVLGRLWSWTNNAEEHDNREEGRTAVSNLTKPVMWVYGDAGAGKSALAQSHAMRCARERRLLGSFFFSSNDTKRSTHAHLAATIAYQAATCVPELRFFIVSAIEQDPKIFEKSLKTQFATLIVDPINTLSNSNRPQLLPHLIIIDGLDECSQDDRQQQSHIVKVLSEAILNCCISLKVLFTSRAEVQIRSTFDSNPLNNLSTGLALDASFRPDDDIRLFLNDTFRDIRGTHPLRRYIPTAWPGYQVVEKLVWKSSGQFIFASTAAKYISSPRHKPADRLEIILGLRERTSDKDIPFAALDALYCQIFSSAPEENMEIVRNIFGLLIFDTSVLFNHLDTLCRFLSLSLEELDFYLMDVIPVVRLDDERLHITHASLSDFLSDQSRSIHYHVEHWTFSASILMICINNLNRNTTQEIMRISLRTFKDFCVTAVQTPDLRESLLAFSLNAIYNWSRKHGPWLDDETGIYDMDEKDGLEDLWSGGDFVKFSTTLFKFIMTLPENSDILNHHLKDFDQYMMKLIAEAINGPGDDDVLLITTLTAIPHTRPPSWAIYRPYYNKKARYVSLSFSRARPFLKKDPPKKSPVFSMLYDFCAVLSGVHGGRFFEDPHRSGRYTLTGARFADAALACLVFLCQNKYGLRIIQDLDNFFSEDFLPAYYAIKYLPDLLTLSAASQQLTAFICCGDLEKMWKKTRILLVTTENEFGLKLADIEPHVVKALQACELYNLHVNCDELKLDSLLEE